MIKFDNMDLGQPEGHGGDAKNPYSPPHPQQRQTEPNKRNWNNLIYLFDPSGKLDQCWAAHLSLQGYQIRTWTNLDELQSACDNTPPGATLVDMDRLGPQREPPKLPACLMTSSRDDMINQLKALRLGACGFLSQSQEPDQLILQLDRLSGRWKIDPYRILIIDDDELLGQHYSTLLENIGVATRTLSDPMLCLDVLRQFTPDLLLVNLEMPACSGQELVAVIRHNQAWAQLPVVFLYAENDPKSQTDMRDLGADEFISKHMAAENLIDILLPRLKRARQSGDLNRSLRDSISESRLLRYAMNQHDILSTTDIAGFITHTNQQFCQISGYTHQELIGRNHNILNSGHHDRDFFHDMWQTLNSGNTWRGEICNRNKDGGLYWVSSTIVPILDDLGHTQQYISLQTNITEIKQAEQLAHQAEVRLKKQQHALTALATDRSLNDPDPDIFAKTLTCTAARALDVARASIWLLDESSDHIHCQMLFEETDKTFSSGQLLARHDFPAYFEALNGNKVIVAGDAKHHPATHEFTECYLNPLNIGAMMDAPIRQSGRAIGVVCFEHLDTSRSWQTDEQAFAASIADLTALALETQRRRKAETAAQHQKKLLNLLHSAMSEFISSRQLRPVADHLLNGILEITGSDYGFTGEVRFDGLDKPYLTTHAVSDNSWNEEMRAYFKKQHAQGLEFRNLDSLLGVAMRTGQPVISNDVANDSRAGGTPDGHPLMKNFLGIPIFRGHDMVALYGLANREKDYDNELLEFLRPFNTTYGVLIDAARMIEREQSTLTELTQAKTEAEQANQAKSKFLSSMSHELRTPMNAVLGFAQLLEIDDLTADQRENVIEIKKAGEHLVDLINEVLDLSGIEAERIQLCIAAVHLKSLVEDCVGLIKPLLKKKRITLNMECNAGDNVHVRADVMRLKQVLVNLLSNACKYNREGGTIRLQSRLTAGKHVQLLVHDTGHGISEKDQQQLFQAFNRLGQENSATEGSGIGLVISQKLIRLMDGQIGAHSQLDKGSTFWVKLPLAQTKNLPYPLPSKTRGETALDKPKDDMVTILYLEDNPANLRLMQQLLSSQPKIKLINAHAPSLCLELAETGELDLIVLNIDLPEMNSHRILKQLRKNKTTPVPVLALSTNPSPVEQDKHLASGFDAYLAGPIQLDQLKETLTRFLPHWPINSQHTQGNEDYG